MNDKQIQACENAKARACHCRCGGALHGRAAGGTHADGSIDRAYFEALGADDPHRLVSREEQAIARARNRKIARLLRQKAEYRARGWASPYWDDALTILDYVE